jgi:RNA polymerase sigma-70 factor (ECF subfamily)
VVKPKTEIVSVTAEAMTASGQSHSPKSKAAGSRSAQNVGCKRSVKRARCSRVFRSEVDVITGYFARRSHDPQTVADLTADTFVEAMRSFDSFDPARGSARAWLFAIARRVDVRRCEPSGHRRDAARRDARRWVLDDPNATDDLLARIDAQHAGRALMERLAGHDPLGRSAVELVDLAGLTPKEAALALGVSPGALRVRLFRARARLRKEDPE